MDEFTETIIEFNKLDVSKFSLSDQANLLNATNEYVRELKYLINKYGEKPKTTRFIWDDWSDEE